MSALSDSDTDNRRAALIGIKLVALVRQHGDAEPGVPTGLRTGAGVIAGETAWVLFHEQPERSLGAALAWAIRHGATALHVLAESATGVLARRATGFTLPIEVFHVEGRALVPAIAEPLPVAEPACAAHREFGALIDQSGARHVEEFGVVSGELRGLEVCRVVDDPVTGVPRLEVGIGAHDREMFQMLQGERTTAEALAGVVSTISVHRSPGAAPHPLNRLGAARLLRSVLEEHPNLIQAATVVAMPPPSPRPNLKDELPCVAVATATAANDAERVAVVCTAGIDLDVVPFAVDAVAALIRDGVAVSSCVIVAPSRDVVDIQQRIAALVEVPTRFVGVDVSRLVAP